MSDHGAVIFLPARATRFVGGFQGCIGLWTAGCWLARRLHHASGFSIFFIFVRGVALRNLDLLIKTGWSVICPFCR